MEIFVVTFLILAVPVLIGWLVLRQRQGPAQVCMHCGHSGQTVAKTPGSTGVELILWLFLLVPGLIYSVWRLHNRRQVCAMCGHDQLVPPQSPAGRKLIAEHAAP